MPNGPTRSPSAVISDADVHIQEVYIREIVTALEAEFVNANVVVTFPLDMLTMPKSNALPDAENELAVATAFPSSETDVSPGFREEPGRATQTKPRSTITAIPNHTKIFLFVIII